MSHEIQVRQEYSVVEHFALGRSLLDTLVTYVLSR